MPGRMQRPVKPAARPSAAKPPPPVVVKRPVININRPQAIPRPASGVINRATNVNRVQGNLIKRNAARQIANQMTQVPRPMVRPGAPPPKIMPARPALNSPSIPRPIVLPAAPGTSRPMPRPVKPVSGTGVSREIPKFHPTQSKPISTGSTITLGNLNTANAHPQISVEVAALQAALTELQSRSSFSGIQTDIQEIDKNLDHVLKLLEGARNKGFVYQGDLDETAYQLVDQWQNAREQAVKTIQQQVPIFQSQLSPLGGQIQRLNMSLGNPNTVMSALGSTHTQVNSLLSNVNEVHYQIERSYADIRSQLGQVNSRLTQIHWALDQLSSGSFKIESGENLVTAVSARWDQEGNEDPEGVLFLTNRRLIFERKEKVATKKMLFLTVASELVQQVMIDQPLSNISTVKAQNKGLFGHQDFIEVQFSDKKLGLIPFHLNGQDSGQWVTWIQKAKTGEIEAEQTSGSGLSYSDMTGPVTSADIMNLQKEANDLQQEITLTGIRQELAALENELHSLERKLVDLRSRGYMIEKSLEGDIKILAVQWDRIKANAEGNVNAQAKLLGDQGAGLQQALSALVGMSGNLISARPQYMQVKSLLASLEAQTDASEAAVAALFDEYSDEVEGLSAHLDWVSWMLDALATATFRLTATESGVAAVESMFARPGLEPENGILFLTDQRILWEDRVDTFELKLEAKVAQIQEVKKGTDEQTGKEFLQFSFGSDATYPTAQFELSLPVADDWLKMAGRAKTGGYAQDTVELDPAELERIRNAPKQCSNCGAVFSTPIFRGQHEITCEYCGVVIRL